jgi:glycerol-3-phosphate O-acyltransferase
MGPGQIPDLRAITAEFGVEIARRINDLITAGRSSVAAAALLGQPANALREEELRERVFEIASLLALLDVPLSESLERCLASGRAEAVVELLEQAERVKRVASPRGDLLQIADGMRIALDLYRASIGHALVWPAVLALGLRAPIGRDALLDGASAWLDLFADEYFPVQGEARRERLERVLGHLIARGWIDVSSADLSLRATETGEPWLAFLRAQLQPLLECYASVARVVAEAGGEGGRDAMLERVKTVQREALLVGEMHYPEGQCPVSAGNALALFLGQGILEADGKAERGEAGYVPGPAYASLDALRARLAAAAALR